MIELRKKVAGDWYTIRESGKSVMELVRCFGLDAPAAHEAATEIRNCVETGMVEYKRQALNRVFSGLDNTRYRTMEGPELAKIERQLAILIFATMVQRLVCDGSINVPGHETAGEKKAEVADQVDLKTIMAEVTAALQEDAGLKANPSIKNILLQIGKYRNEMETLKKLTQNAAKDMAKNYIRNFQAKTDEITTSARKHYQEFLAGKQATAPKTTSQQRAETGTALVGFLTAQAERFAELRSSVAFARNEQYGMREFLVGLADKRETMLAALADEQAELVKADAAGGDRAAVRTLKVMAMGVAAAIMHYVR